MTDETKLIAGILLMAVTTIEFGGTFLLSILSGKHFEFTEFQRSMFRAGHAHAAAESCRTISHRPGRSSAGHRWVYACANSCASTTMVGRGNAKYWGGDQADRFELRWERMLYV